MNATTIKMTTVKSWKAKIGIEIIKTNQIC